MNRLIILVPRARNPFGLHQGLIKTHLVPRVHVPQDQQSGQDPILFPESTCVENSFCMLSQLDFSDLASFCCWS